MQFDPFTCIISTAYDAAISPDRWACALQAVTSYVGAAGAAYIIFEKQSRQVDWACFTGPSVEMKRDYVRHYAALDPYLPILTSAPYGKWLALSECLSEPVLRSDEWYNDFHLKSGVGDILGVRLFDSSSHAVFLGVHQEIGRRLFNSRKVKSLAEIFEPLSRAAGLHVELRERGLRSDVTEQALGALATAIIVTDSEGHVIQINPVAEQILGRNDGLAVRNGKLVSLRAFENEKLKKLLEAATNEAKSKIAIGHILLSQRGGRPGYSVTVASLSPETTHYERPLAMIVVTDPAIPSATSRQLTDLFGLSAAECRLANALMAGKTIQDITLELDVQITTLRTQLSSILKKVEVKRQVDLIRVLSRIPRISGDDIGRPKTRG
jgi:DNA-binding CsgD family transcriptional regulator